MKKYLLFYGDDYYPNGGVADFKQDYETLEEAVDAGTNACSHGKYADGSEMTNMRWWQVALHSTLEEVAHGESPNSGMR